MENIILSERLLMVSSFVRGDTTLADIGTDHAYLPVYLIISGKIKTAVAADINKGPLQNAEKTVKSYGLEDKITLRLSNGLQSISENEASDLVLAGMGGDLISDILSACGWIKKKGIRIIAQPQTHSEKVREFFINNGFEILSETACEDEKRCYICLCAEYTGEKREYGFGYTYFGELPKCEKAQATEYLIHQRNRIFKRLSGLKESNQNKDECDFLDRLLCKFNEILGDKNG